MLLVCREAVSASDIQRKLRREIKLLEKDLVESLGCVSRMMTSSAFASKRLNLNFY